MEQEHPIPQQISAYQFRLVGDMTIKQFFQVAAGALVAILLYSSSMPTIFKWPLIVLSFLTGVAFAFVSIQDRPLPKWLFLFLKSVYSPTLFTWQKGAKQPQYFQPEDGQQYASASAQMPVSEGKKSDTPTNGVSDKLEKKEQEFLQNVSKHFAGGSGSVAMPTPSFISKAQPPVQPQIKTKEEKIVGVTRTTPIQMGKPSNQPQDYSLKSQAPTTSTGMQVTPFPGEKLGNIKEATFSEDASPPVPPTRANIIVGQVVDKNGGIIEAAILEIKDAEGRSVRALKSNKLGHFIIVTPLENGKYEIITEKEGYQFSPVSFEAKGEIIPPIVIKSL